MKLGIIGVGAVGAASASCKFKTENEGRLVEWRVGKGFDLGFDFSNVHGRPKGKAYNRGSSTIVTSFNVAGAAYNARTDLLRFKMSASATVLNDCSCAGFSDACMTKPLTRSHDRRPRSAKARNRGPVRSE
jgi:hypothetical protein